MASKSSYRAARAGRIATSRGRAVVAGVGDHERVLGVRTTPYELWAPLRVLQTEDVGLVRLQTLHGTSLDGQAFRRFLAYLSQAETYYLSAQTMPPESRPLVAYYFVLNLTKAFLTCADPALTAQRGYHGLTDGFVQHSRYWFQHEVVRINGTRANGTNVFRELAQLTGAGYCHPAGHELQIKKLAPYLVETADLLEDATDLAPKLLPVRSVSVMGRAGEAWLRVAVDNGELRRRGAAGYQLPKRAHHFASVFEPVSEGSISPEVYESVDKWSYKSVRRAGRLNYSNASPFVVEAFEESLIHSNRGTTGARHLIVLSDRQDLLSQESVAFLLMLHLSNMVRYRPEQVAKLVGSRWFFLFTTWVPRAMENFLLALMSRILKEEVRIG